MVRRFSPAVMLVGFFGVVASISACSASDSSPEYCDVEPVIEEKCLRCHGDPTENGAPFPLDTYERVYEKRVMVEHVIERGSMPFLDPELSPPVEDITQAETDLILEWLDADAPDCSQ